MCLQCLNTEVWQVCGSKRELIQTQLLQGKYNGWKYNSYLLLLIQNTVAGVLGDSFRRDNVWFFVIMLSFQAPLLQNWLYLNVLFCMLLNLMNMCSHHLKCFMLPVYFFILINHWVAPSWVEVFSKGATGVAQTEKSYEAIWIPLFHREENYSRGNNSRHFSSPLPRSTRPNKFTTIYSSSRTRPS